MGQEGEEGDGNEQGSGPLAAAKVYTNHMDRAARETPLKGLGCSSRKGGYKCY